MRSLSESTERWQQTLNHSSSFTDLQKAVQADGPESPCVSGCRSICWKAFLLNQAASTASWSRALREARSSYSSFRDHFLKYIKHPEYLNAGSLDPLADDADSPWNTLRHDQTLRAEILQDVERLPDLPFYHEPRIQTMILDIIFIFCKLNPDVGGYRQGMHELLAPIVYVVEQDAIDPAAEGTHASTELMMVEMLDASFVEHDSFSLFAKVMDHAKGFYEVNESPDAGAGVTTAFGTQSTRSSIVEKSMYIHEVCLQAIDPELATHLTAIEILPQIFLIRWVRLLFSREFPFEQMLVLWDTIFSVDPTFQLIDLICTAMLVRIRWDLIEADYSGALQLLLRYPAPDEPHGPHTFVEDAIYLRDNLNIEGGSTLIHKYTGRRPSDEPAGAKAPTTAPIKKTPFRQPQLRPPMSPSRLLSQQGDVGAILQGAAKGVFERSEKLGINQAVRDAMLEIRRNVSEAKSSMLANANRDIFTDSGQSTAVRAVAVLDHRNAQLAEMLGDALSALKELASSELVDKHKCKSTLEIATAKLDVVKLYLEDSTMALPENIAPQPKINVASGNDTTATTTNEVKEAAPICSATESQNVPQTTSESPVPENAPVQSGSPSRKVKAEPEPTAKPLTPPDSQASINDPLGSGDNVPSLTAKTLQRPQAPNPTRSTIAQSSFAWMLEPDQSESTPPIPSLKKPTSPTQGSGGHRKRPSANANRERTAFLFGDDITPGDEGSRGDGGFPEDLFGLKPLRRTQQ